MTRAQLAHPWLAHALAAHVSAATGDWHRFFVLYRNAPNMGASRARPRPSACAALTAARWGSDARGRRAAR